MDFDDLVYADLSERGKLRFTGPQRAWFLHQITTQHFDPIEPGEGREAALLTPHGRMVAYFEAVATDDAILVHFEHDLLATFPDAVAHYVFATQVEIEDVTDSMSLVLVAGPGHEAISGAAVQPTHALGCPAAYIWDPADLGGAREASENELEFVRISNGVPRWGYDMNQKTLPQETGLEKVAIHLDKGCYVGQEAVAKIHFRGKVNRRLRLLESPESLAVGTEVALDDAKVGVVTSSAGENAIAMLRYTVEPGTLVTVGDVQAKVVA
jgi:folate-binding protein YgfZ